MHPVNDIELVHPALSLALASRLASQAVEALTGLAGRGGYRVDNQAEDGGVLTEVEEDQAKRLALAADVKTALPVVADVPPGFSLATVVASDALLDLLISQPTWMTKLSRARVVARMDWLLKQDPAASDPLHPENEDMLPALSLLRHAMLCRAICKLLAWRPAEDDLPRESMMALDELKPRAAKRLAALTAPFTGATDALDADAVNELHPYVMCCVIGALVALAEEPWQRFGEDLAAADQVQLSAAQLWSQSRGRMEQLVAQHAMGLLGARGVVACALYAAAAALLDKRHHLEALVKAAVDERHSVGGWQQGRVIAQDADGARATVTLAVPPWEILRTLGSMAAASLDDSDDEPAPTCRSQLLAAVVDALPAAEAAFIDDDGVTGWPGEQPYRRRLVEAWPTASVLGMALTAHDVVERVERHHVLEALAANSSRTRWPEWLEWDAYRKNEPEKDARILEFIHEEVVQPRVGRASGAARKTKVVLLFGPPGTTKTTIARSVANGLGWPIVSLSPGTFIQDGLEQIEKRAEWVFSRLQKLQRTVVIFDECDELFRERKPDPKNEPVRQVAAFMTASMLPKLQDLHDRSSIVVFICTNFLDSMDPAIRRPGRVDYLVAVSPPDELQRRRIIIDELRKAGVDLDGAKADEWKIAVDTLAARTDDLIRGEIVTLAQQLAAAEFAGISNARETANEVAKSVPEELRTIKNTAEEYKRFVSSREVISAPHRRAMQRKKDHPDA